MNARMVHLEAAVSAMNGLMRVEKQMLRCATRYAGAKPGSAAKEKLAHDVADAEKVRMAHFLRARIKLVEAGLAPNPTAQR